MNNTELDELLEDLRAGDEQAWQEVQGALGARLLGFARCLLPSRADAEGVVQEGAIYTYRHIVGGGTVNSVESCMFQGVRLALSTQRKSSEARWQQATTNVQDESPTQMASLEALACTRDGPHQQLIATECKELIREAIRQLREPHRTTVMLRAIDERSFQEVAELTEVSIKTAQNRFYQARLELKETLQIWLGPNP